LKKRYGYDFFSGWVARLHPLINLIPKITKKITRIRCIVVFTTIYRLVPLNISVTLTIADTKLNIKNVINAADIAFFSLNVIEKADKTANDNEQAPSKCQRKFESLFIPVRELRIVVPKNKIIAPTPLKTALIRNKILSPLFCFTMKMV